MCVHVRGATAAVLGLVMVVVLLVVMVWTGSYLVG